MESTYPINCPEGQYPTGINKDGTSDGCMTATGQIAEPIYQQHSHDVLWMIPFLLAIFLVGFFMGLFFHKMGWDDV